MTGDHQTLALLLFSTFVAVTLGITTWVSRHRHGSAEEFYAGGRLFSPMENGFAIAGDYMSAASFLGISGVIALYGYDGMLYSVGFLVAWLVVLFLVAELVRNCGRFTLADVVAARMRERPVRIAAGTSSVTVSVMYLVAQMVGAGSLVALLLGGTSEAARTWTVIGVGALMVIYVSLGGMRATTWIQIVKAVLLLGGTVALTTLVLVRFHGDLDRLLRTAAERSGHGEAFLAPGLAYGGDWTSRFDFISLGLALVLGTAGLPHILSRFYTVPTARAARRSVVWSIGLIGGFYLMTIVLGFGAAALVGTDAVRASNAAGNTAVPLLALDLGGGAGSTGGTVLFAVVAAVAFATILAVVAGVTLASSASVAHDLYASLRRRDADRAGRSPWRASPPSGSARSRSVSACSPATSTSRSWWASPSPSPRPPTCRCCSTRCSGAASPHAAPCGPSTGASSPPWCSSCCRPWCRAVSSRCSRASTSSTSRCRIPVWCRSRWASWPGGSARSPHPRSRTRPSTRRRRCGP